MDITGLFTRLASVVRGLAKQLDLISWLALALFVIYLLTPFAA